MFGFPNPPAQKIIDLVTFNSFLLLSKRLLIITAIAFFLLSKINFTGDEWVKISILFKDLIFRYSNIFPSFFALNDLE